MISNVTILLLIITMTSVASQTFQYSRGWTNGKRDGQKREDLSIEKILNPCQMQKIEYMLQGRPLSERLLAPCDYIEEDTEKPMQYKPKHGQDSLYDAFQ